ncbi:MAG: GNAT family N-acetyltransferase [Bacilli bacterium]|nr:GNAT family N-acetyltransferase [Bacilli bacterium]
MVREFNVLDVEDVIRLGNCLYDNFENIYDVKGLLNDEYTKVFVYEKDDEIVGFLMFTKIYETIDILAIVVDENYRNLNIATCLIDYMISEYNDDLKMITLEVVTDNIPAIKLYEKFGFEIVNIRKKYFNGKDSYLMAVNYK